MSPLRLLAFLLATLLSAASVAAATLGVSPTQTEIAVPTGLNHLPLRLPITHSASLAGVTTSSDSAWVIPTIDIGTGELVLTFATTALTNPAYTAVITLTDGPTKAQVSIKATVSSLNIVRLIDDPTRNRTYGLHQNGLNAGALVIFDPIRQSYLGCISLGQMPADFAVKPDGTELIAICAASRTLAAVNLAGLQAAQPVALPAFGECSSPQYSAAHVSYGPGTTVYYTDHSTAPVLRVLDRSTGAVLQTLARSAGPGDSSSAGFGAITYRPGPSTLLTWSQYGWDNGQSSNVITFSANSDGSLVFGSKMTNAFVASPSAAGLAVLTSSDDAVIAIQSLILSGSDLSLQRTIAEGVVALSPRGEIVSTMKGVYETVSGTQLYSFPDNYTVQAFTSDYARLVYFNPWSRELKSLSLIATVDSDVLHRNISPEADAIIAPPSGLSWDRVTGAGSYQVYLGTDATAVAAATPTAPEYRGSVSVPNLPLSDTLSAGTTYYWRVDAINGSDVTPGEVFAFTVSPIAVSASHFKASTIQGDRNTVCAADLTSASPGRAWSATMSAPWINLQAASGVTPATLIVRLDASQLPLGLNTGSITLTTEAGPLVLPVQLQVDSLGVILLSTPPGSTKTYAISSATFDGISPCYLLEIDCATEAITRVVPVGKSVTAFTIHPDDGRIYVANWNDGVQLAVDLTTFKVVRRYASPAYNGLIPYVGDVARVAAGGPGRLATEGGDQWTHIELMDTNSGALLDTVSPVRAGGGLYDVGKRYYYHGDSGSSGAKLTKYDTATGKLIAFTSAAAPPDTYGSSTIVQSDDGARIFWGGAMYDGSPALLWNIADIIYATSADGRYAFSDTAIYDTVQRKIVLGMPLRTTKFAFNSATVKLVVQRGSSLKFYPIDPSAPLSGPILTVGNATSSRVSLSWSETSLESGFTLQKRVAGTSAWIDVSSTITSNTTSYTVSGLDNGTPYEFRLKATALLVESDWSPVVSTATPPEQPPTPSITKIQSLTPGTAVLTLSARGLYDDISIDRMLSTEGKWSPLTTIPASPLTYTDTGLATDTTYYYRIRTRRATLYSQYSNEVFVHTPRPAAPSFDYQPSSLTTFAGAYVQLGVGASGFPAPTYQWRKDGNLIAGATGSDLVIEHATPADVGTYDVVITNTVGSATSRSYTLTLLPVYNTYFGTFPNNNGFWALYMDIANGQGVFLGRLTQPQATFRASVHLGDNGSFYTWPNGGGGVVIPPIPPGGSGVIPLPGSSNGNSTGGSSHPVAYDTLSTVSITGTLTADSITGQIAELGQTFTGPADTTGPTSAYARSFSISQVAGSTGSIYAIVGHDGQAVVVASTADFVDAGSVSVSPAGVLSGTMASGAQLTGSLRAGLSADQPITLTPVTGPAVTFWDILSSYERTDRLVNLASRGTSGTGDRVMILGFVIGGSTPRNVLIRGVGPTLSGQGVTRPMTNPMIELFNSAHTSLAQNEDWSAAANAQAMADAATHTGAFALPAGSRDASLLVQLNPGVYSAITHDDNDTSGVALTEIYDVDGMDSTTPAIVNLSIRGNVDRGDGVLIAGFVVTGNSPKRLLIRAVGPTLATMGLQSSEVLADPMLRIVQGGTVLLTNDNWAAAPNASDIPSTASYVGAFSLPANSKDAVILTTLAPGVYSAVASGVNGTTGIALVEVYQVP